MEFSKYAQNDRQSVCTEKVPPDRDRSFARAAIRRDTDGGVCAPESTLIAFHAKVHGNHQNHLSNMAILNMFATHIT
jgi:hypothetical protein